MVKHCIALLSPPSLSPSAHRFTPLSLFAIPYSLLLSLSCHTLSFFLSTCVRVVKRTDAHNFFLFKPKKEKQQKTHTHRHTLSITSAYNFFLLYSRVFISFFLFGSSNKFILWAVL